MSARLVPFVVFYSTGNLICLFNYPLLKIGNSVHFCALFISPKIDNPAKSYEFNVKLLNVFFFSWYIFGVFRKLILNVFSRTSFCKHSFGPNCPYYLWLIPLHAWPISNSYIFHQTCVVTWNGIWRKRFWCCYFACRFFLLLFTSVVCIELETNLSSVS